MDISSAMFWLFVCFVLACHLLRNLSAIECYCLGAVIGVSYELLDVLGVHIVFTSL